MCCLKSPASINDYLYPNNLPSYSNYGTIGLIQNPTSRFLEEGSLALSWTHNEPYLRGSVIAYPFNFFEASYQYVDINNVLYSDVKEFSGSQSRKDKSFDIKLRLLRESGSFPQLAIGFRDLAGTGVFASEYVVMNKLIRNFDVSLGLGWGVMSNRGIRNPLLDISDNFSSRAVDKGRGGKFSTDAWFSGEMGVFGGFEYFFPGVNGLRFKLEYDATDYSKEGFLPLNQKSKINYGFVYPVNNHVMLKLSYVKGDTLNFGFSISLNAKRDNPLNQKKNKMAPVQNTNEVQFVTSKSKSNLYKASLKYLTDRSINLQSASLEDNKLHITYAQSKFVNSSIAVGRALRVLNDIAPKYVNEFKVSQLNGGLGMFSVSIMRDDLKRALSNKNSDLIKKSIMISAYNPSENSFEFNPKVEYPKIFNSISPDLRTQIGGPDGFFFGDLKLTARSELLLRKNLSFVSVLTYGLVDNMDKLKLESDSVLPHVRTDIVKYLKESRGLSIRRAQLNYFKQISSSVYSKLSMGIFESMFGAYGGEILFKPIEGNYAAGVEIWHAFQRDYDQLFKFQDYDTLTGHLTLYYQEPRSNVLFKLKGGRYLAKDSGVTFDFSRRFKSGMQVGAFFSLTDISEEEFGEGSFDKGFYFFIPVHVFSPRYYKRNFGWGLKPMTRDGAQSINYAYPLWGVTDPASKHLFEENLYNFYD